MQPSEKLKSDQFNSEKHAISFKAKQIEPKKDTFLSRFIDRVKGAFFPSSKTFLTGKTQELQKHAHHTLNNLLHVKEELKLKVNSELYKHVESAIDPIAREAKRIEKMMALPISNLESEKNDKKFQQWLAKADRWVRLDSKMNLQVSIIEAIIEQNFSETDELIDQDLQVIADYEMHILSNLPLSEEEKQNLTKIINDKLSYHIGELAKLKEKPEALEFHKITLWKNEVNLMRSHHFDHALHKIDAMIEEFSPLNDSEVPEHGQLEELEHEADLLEQEAQKLMSEATQDAIDEQKKNTFLSRFQWLQQKTHQHHLDLHLPPKESDKLDRISFVIERISKNINEKKNQSEI